MVLSLISTRTKTDRTLRYCFFGLWCAFFFFLLSRHTPWRDEYQSYLVSIRTRTWTEFFEAVRYEGGSPLLYLLQRTVYSINPMWFSEHARFAIDVITVPFTLASAVLILFALDLKLLQSVLFLFGTMMLREFGIISRSYIIGFFFLLLAVIAFRQKRFRTSLLFIFLCASAHALFFLVSGAWMLLAARAIWPSKNNARLAFCVAVIGFLLLAVMLIPPGDSEFGAVPTISWFRIWRAIDYLNGTLWNFEGTHTPFEWMIEMSFINYGWYLLLLIPALFLIWRQVRILPFLLLTFPTLFYLSFFRTYAVRYVDVAFSGFLVAYLLYPTDKKKWRGPDALTLFLIPGVLSSCFWLYNWHPFSQPTWADFSGTRELIEHGPPGLLAPNAHLLIQTEYQFFTWMAETNRTVFSSHRNRSLYYPRFSKDDRLYPTLNDWCIDHIAEFKRQSRDGTIYIGLPLGGVPPVYCGSLKKVFSTSRPIITDESFDIYELVAIDPLSVKKPATTGH